MKRNVNLYANDILESILQIEEYVKNASRKIFMENKQIQDATLRRLEIIGEAVKNIPQEIRKKYPRTPWKEIAGMRDVVTHIYFGVNIERVWNVVKNDLPKLKEEIKKISEK